MKLRTLIPTAQAALAELSVEVLTQDSRNAGPGSLFFAIEGTARDGHAFVADVLSKGAAAAVVRADHPNLAGIDRARLIETDDPRRLLGEAASRFYGEPSQKLLVCGVTGTNGKTTSTYLLEALLAEAGEKPAVIGTIEKRFGAHRVESSRTTPDALELQKDFREFLDYGATAVAMEVSSHALEQRRIAGTRFAATLFTNLTQDHLDYHHSMEEYFLAKLRLFTDYPSKVRAIHVDDPYGRRLAAECAAKGLETVTFGAGGASTAGSTINVSYGELHMSANGISGPIAIDYRGARDLLHVQSPLIGGFNAQNIAGVVAVGVGLRIPLARVAAALAGAQPVPGRMETVPNRRGITVVVDYAHTPDALEKALRTLRDLKPRRLHCVFGCGGDRDAHKRPLMGEIAERLADQVYVTCDNPRSEDPEKILDQILRGLKDPAKAHRISDRRGAIAAALAGAQTGDICLIAGKGHEDYQIIGTQKLPFDDRKVAAENLSNGPA